MYSSGEFSKITGLSLKALRLYHQRGLLRPTEVDSGNGYRFYSRADVETARVVQLLKGMGFSLAEISQLLEHYQDEADILSFLLNKQRQLTRELERLTDISKAIDHIVKKETEVKQMTQQSPYKIEIKQLEPQLVASMRWQGRYQDTGLAMKKVHRAAMTRACGAPFNLYYDEGYREDNAEIESCLPISAPVQGDGICCRTLDGGRFVTLLHQGPYDTLGQSYARLYDFIQAEGLQVAPPGRAVMLKSPGMIFKGNPQQYLTEIQLPITE